VVKKNGLRTEFSREKLRASLELALRKRPVTIESVDAAVAASRKNCCRPASAKSHAAVGELVMRELKKLDKVAYIRFASVYRNFEDVDAFSKAIREVSPASSSTSQRKNDASRPSTTAHGPRPATGRARAVDDLAQSAGRLCARQDGEIVGEGWHEKAGEPHAEVHALRAAGSKAGAPPPM
jgi:hypothetical protein